MLITQPVTQKPHTTHINENIMLGIDCIFKINIKRSAESTIKL